MCRRTTLMLVVMCLLFGRMGFAADKDEGTSNATAAAKATFQKLDRNGDGVLSFAEFSASMPGATVEKPAAEKKAVADKQPDKPAKPETPAKPEAAKAANPKAETDLQRLIEQEVKKALALEIQKQAKATTPAGDKPRDTAKPDAKPAAKDAAAKPAAKDTPAKPAAKPDAPKKDADVKESKPKSDKDND